MKMRITQPTPPPSPTTEGSTQSQNTRQLQKLDSENLHPWKNLVGNTNKMLIFPGGCNGRTNTSRQN